MRLASDVQAILRQLPIDQGGAGAAAGTAQTLTPLLEISTVRRPDDPTWAAFVFSPPDAQLSQGHHPRLEYQEIVPGAS